MEDKSIGVHDNMKKGSLSIGGSIVSGGARGSGCKDKGVNWVTGANANEDNVANSSMTTSTGGSNRNDSPIGVNEESSASGCRIGSGHKGGITNSNAKEDNVASSSMTPSSSNSNSNVSTIGANEESNASDGGNTAGGISSPLRKSKRKRQLPIQTNFWKDIEQKWSKRNKGKKKKKQTSNDPRDVKKGSVRNKKVTDPQ